MTDLGGDDTEIGDGDDGSDRHPVISVALFIIGLIKTFFDSWFR